MKVCGGVEECVGRNGGVWWKGWKCVAGEVEVYERGRSVVGGVRSVVGGVRCVVIGVERCGREWRCAVGGVEVRGRDRGVWWE